MHFSLGNANLDSCTKVDNPSMTNKELTYDASCDRFSDGSVVDWFLYEPVATMHVMNNDKKLPPLPLTDAHWQAAVSLPCKPRHTCVELDFAELRMPVERDGVSAGRQYRTIKLPAQLTVSSLFTAIHAFYDTPITKADLSGHNMALDKLRSVFRTDVAVQPPYVGNIQTALR